MSIPALVEDLLSEVSESELSETLNTTAFDTATHATPGDLPNTETAGDFVEIKGKPYVSVHRTANLRAGSTPFWIWDYGCELRLLAGQTVQNCWQCTYCGKVMPVDSTAYHAGRHLEGGHHLQVFLALDPPSSFLMTNQVIDYGTAVASGSRGLSK
jgi:hypothetical protein